ncbi:MAG: SRPBCC family protein [Solibacillus sp.]
MMASSVSRKTITADHETAWQYLLDREAWAVLMPGYLHHEITSADEMIWVFKGDFGFVQKAVKLQLEVKERIEHEKIAFDLVGLSDNISGSGYFEVQQDELIGQLEMKAGGFLASMINPVLADIVPNLVEQLVDAMATSLTTQNV